MSARRRLIAIFLILIALLLLYPGVTQPVLTLSGTLQKSELAEMGIDTMLGDNADPRSRQMLTMISSLLGFDEIEGELEAYNNTRSIWGTVTELARTGNNAVAFLVMLFSIVIPLFKLLMQLGWLLVRSPVMRRRLGVIIEAVSKWSMADVFVMALIVAYMAGSASGHMGDLLTMHATLELGFWFFLAYCLFSIASTALVREPAESTESAADH